MGKLSQIRGRKGGDFSKLGNIPSVILNKNRWFKHIHKLSGEGIK